MVENAWAVQVTLCLAFSQWHFAFRGVRIWSFCVVHSECCLFCVTGPWEQVCWSQKAICMNKIKIFHLNKIMAGHFHGGRWESTVLTFLLLLSINIWIINIQTHELSLEVYVVLLLSRCFQLKLLNLLMHNLKLNVFIANIYHIFSTI